MGIINSFSKDKKEEDKIDEKELSEEEFQIDEEIGNSESFQKRISFGSFEFIFDIYSDRERGRAVKIVRNSGNHGQYEMFLVMKIYRKSVIRHSDFPGIIPKQIRIGIMEELKLLKGCLRNHKFFPELYYAFEDSTNLYQVTRFYDGGDMFEHLDDISYSMDRIVYCCAEIFIGVSYLHSKKYIHRDLKPENIFFLNDGHLVIGDLESAKYVGSGKKAKTPRGTPEYRSPEIMSGDYAYSYEVDWWSYGVIVYLLITGSNPFYDDDICFIRQKVLKKEIKIPQDNPIVADFLSRLLQRDPSKRLGANGSDEISNHPFFKGIDFERMKNHEIPPPFRPKSRFLPLLKVESFSGEKEEDEWDIYNFNHEIEEIIEE